MRGPIHKTLMPSSASTSMFMKRETETQRTSSNNTNIHNPHGRAKCRHSIHCDVIDHIGQKITTNSALCLDKLLPAPSGGRINHWTKIVSSSFISISIFEFIQIRPIIAKCAENLSNI